MSKFQLAGVAVLVLIVIVYSGRGVAGNEAATQDPAGLDRRISMLEQRFYSLESSINRLQQAVASQRSTGSTPATNDREITVLSQELQRLQLRMTEIECGLVKLDERTMTASARRSGDQKSTDPCRSSPNTPLRLSARP
jgi:predicted  nucleic acid-binding Zn-ribbon protein